MLRHPVLGRLLAVDFLYWFTFAVYQTTFALFGARRFNFGVPQTGYLLAFLGLIGVIVQLVLVGRVARRFGERRMLVAGLVLAGAGLAAASFIDQVVYFVLALLPAALGTALAIPAITSLISQTARPQEQGRVQGVSSALEGLGRALGPLWGNGLLGFYGEGTAFLTAACVMGLTGLLAARGPRRGARPAPQRTTS
jgi:DHA1 family tetracycline resistance protein-like MFS transporter